MLYRKLLTICQIFEAFFLVCSFGCSAPAISPPSSDESVSTPSKTTVYDAVMESGKYTTKDSVAAYLCKFDKLPQNYMGKNEGHNPWKTLGVMIGGDDFNNFTSDPDYYHSTLPEGKYREADVDYGNVTSRGTKRLVYQSGCIIYYTADHYETFNKLVF